MKALTTLKSAINQSSVLGSIALIMLSPYVLPHLALAAVQTPDSQAQVFTINVPDSVNLNPSQTQNDSQTSLTLDTIVASDPLVVNLDAYLAAKHSPLSGSAAQLVTFPHWQRAIGISLVESNFCQYTPKVKTKSGWIESYNCSGMETRSGGYQMFDNYLGWFDGLNKLLDKPAYVNRPLEKFIGFYVVPGSISWLHGVQKTESDLQTMVAQAETQRQELAQAQLSKLAEANTILTFADSTN
jgi:hypothetical protein